MITSKCILFASVCIALALCGCGSQGNPRKASTRGLDESAPAIQLPPETRGTESGVGNATLSLDKLKLPGNELVIRATHSNWKSEEFADAAKLVLDRICELLIRRDTIQSTQLDDLADDGFTCQVYPSALDAVFRDQELEVLRPAREFGEFLVAGREAGAKELTALAEPLQKATEVRYEHKVVRVENDATTLKTKSLVHLFGSSAEARVQINLIWESHWKPDPQRAPTLLSLRTVDYEEVHARTAAAFVDCTEAALGASPYWQQIVSFGTDHWLDRIETRYGLDPAGWQGIALGDVNGDGLDDVYVCQPGGLPNGLLIHSPDGTLSNSAGQSGVDFLDQTQSALLVDLDNDGDQDLVLAMTMGVMILSNDGSGRFAPRAAKLLPAGMPYSLSAADFDQDADLDLYVCCYAKRKGGVSHRFLGRPIPYHDANNGTRNALFRNNGDWKFQDVTQQVGLSQHNTRFSFAAAWDDFDNDGDLDLYVANDYGRNNLYRNDDGKFVDVAQAAGVEDISAGMSVSWGDINNDGWMDLYVSNMFSSAGNRVAYQREFQPDVDLPTRSGFQRHARGNSLFVNAGKGTFQDASVAANVAMGRWAWGSTLVDLNSDGWKDIVVSNGFLTQQLPDDL